VVIYNNATKCDGLAFDVRVGILGANIKLLRNGGFHRGSVVRVYEWASGRRYGLVSIRKLRSQSMRHLMRNTGLSEHAIERTLRGENVHLETRLKLMEVARTFDGSSGENWSVNK